MTVVYLVRHGENVANVTREMSHKLVDYDLTERGRLQAAQTAEFFRGKPVDAVYASPLRRAQQTARAIADAHGLPVQTLEGLREINVGELEDPAAPYTLAERWAKDNEVVAAWVAGRPETRYPGGENYLEAVERALAALEEALSGREGQTVVLVGHSGLYQSVLPVLSPEAHRPHLRTYLPLGGYGHLTIHGLRPPRADLHAWAVNDHHGGDALNKPERPEGLKSSFVENP